MAMLPERSYGETVPILTMKVLVFLLVIFLATEMILIKAKISGSQIQKHL